MERASQNGNKSQNGGLIDGWCVNGDDVGTGIMEGEAEPSALPYKVSRVMHQKGMRRLAAYMRFTGDDFGEWELNALTIIDLWCSLHQREGGPIQTIIDWSGYRYRWQNKVRSGIERGIKLKTLELISCGKKGNKLCLTTKGYRVLELYPKFCAKVLDEFEDTRQKVEERKRKAELIRSIRKAS